MTSSLFVTSRYNIIYAFSRPDAEGLVGHLKIGETHIDTLKHWKDITQEEINNSAHERIREYVTTALVDYKLEGAWLAIRDEGNDVLKAFTDGEVRNILYNTGYTRYVHPELKGQEWVKNVSAEKVAEAVETATLGGKFLTGGKEQHREITLYPHQELAVRETIESIVKGTFEKPKRWLWNAKMRFGKTVAAFSMIKGLPWFGKIIGADTPGFDKVLILTHQPVTNDSWKGDYIMMGLKDHGWHYSSRRFGDSFQEFRKGKDKYFWFASIQDLRMADEKKEGETYRDKEAVLDQEWDLIITDEVHEGTLTEISGEMFKRLKARAYLDLSGTPFNILAAGEEFDYNNRFIYDGVFNWSPLDEAYSKRNWDKVYPGVPNPYRYMPDVRFFGYELDEIWAEDRAKAGLYYSTSLNDLFAVGDDGFFVHEEQVYAFLRKLLGDSKYNQLNPELFPYHRSHRDALRHAIWIMPTAKAATAMYELLNRSDSGFAGYNIVNATGYGNKGKEEGESADALDRVKEAVKGDRSITLSYQMLTQGVNVPEWSAVLVLSETESPQKYLQSIFRATTPYNTTDGKIKNAALVFDFKDSRMLSSVHEMAMISGINSAKKLLKEAETPSTYKDRAEERRDSDKEKKRVREQLEKALEFMSVVSIEGSGVVEHDSENLLKKMYRNYVDEVIRTGFYSPRIWNGVQLKYFDVDRARVMNKLATLTGFTRRRDRVIIGDLTEEEVREREARLKELQEKAKKDAGLTPDEKKEEKKVKRELKKASEIEKRNKDNAERILAGVAARVPMLVFAAEIGEAITPENFNELIDDRSWSLFMPDGLERVKPDHLKKLEKGAVELEDKSSTLYWEDIAPFFEEEVFVQACDRIREIVLEAGLKDPTERALRISALFSTFRNPDKETVLTPLRVVVLQVTSTLGGFSFLDLETSTAEENYVFLKDSKTGVVETVEIMESVDRLDEGGWTVAVKWYPPGVGGDEDFAPINPFDELLARESLRGLGVGEAVSRVLEGTGLSLPVFARAFGVSMATASAWRRGGRISAVNRDGLSAVLEALEKGGKGKALKTLQEVRVSRESAFPINPSSSVYAAIEEVANANTVVNDSDAVLTEISNRSLNMSGQPDSVFVRERERAFKEAVDFSQALPNDSALRRSTAVLDGLAGGSVGEVVGDVSVGVGEEFWKSSPTILDPNAKTGLYPLFSALNLYLARLFDEGGSIEASSQEFKRELWRDVVSNNIFINVGAEYSKLIVQRVLFGYEGEDAEVNATYLDITEFLEAVKWWNNRDGFRALDPGENIRTVTPVYWERVKDDTGFTGRVLTLLSEEFLRLHGSTELKVAMFDLGVSSARVRGLVGKILGEAPAGEAEYKDWVRARLEAFRELKNIVKEVGEDLPKWSAVIGNPPYQVNFRTEGANKAAGVSIYPKFFQIAFNIGEKVSLITPARWFTSQNASIKPARTDIIENDRGKHFRSVFFYEDANDLFSIVRIAGGLSFWLYDSSYSGKTAFVLEGEQIGRKSLVENGLVNFDFDLSEIRNTINNHKDYLDTLPLVSWKSTVESLFQNRFGSASTKTILENTSNVKKEKEDITLVIPKYEDRYAPNDWFDETTSVPKGKYAITFTHASSDNRGTLNDRTDFLNELSSSKSTMAVIVDTPEQFVNLYKYSRTKLFKLLVEGRLSSHNTYPQAYQDIPWWFNFDETDPIDWSGSVAEVEKELEEYLGLEEYHDYIQAVDKPFARGLDEAAVERLKKELLKRGSPLALEVDSLGAWE